MKLKNRTDSKLDIEISRTSRFSRLYIVALKVGFGCLSYLMAGLSLGLVYVLSEMDYFVLSGVFRGERFFSDDGYYFAKQVVLVYGVFGFGCVLLLGPIGRQCVILWSWLLTFGYICVCIFVYLGRMSEYGVLLMRFMSIISLISHMSLCNFMFFLFDPNVTDSNSVIYRVLGFILGYFVCCPIVSFVLLRINVCVGLGFCQSDPVDSAFEMCRIVLTIFSISLISSICLTFQFVYDYLTNTDTGFVWVPSLMISNKVVAKTLFNFIDFELLCVVWLVNPIIITLVPYTTASHSQFHTLTFTHKLTFSLTLFIILLIVHRDFVQQCFRNLGKLNMAIFNIMYTDGYIQLVDKHLRETPISTTPFPNYINTCSSDTPSNTAIRKTENTVVVPGFVAYPYLEDPFDDIDNQDKYLLYNYNNSPDAGFSLMFNGVNNYYSQFCKYIAFVQGSIDINTQLFSSYNQQLFVSIFNIINLYDNQKDTISKNINYLKYFYHLFPIHVEKFYSLFDRYLNHRFLQLKSSIGCLVSDISSLCSFISRLEAIKCNFYRLSLPEFDIYSMLCSQIRDFNQKLIRVVLLNEKASNLGLERIKEDLRSKIDSARGNLKAIKMHIIGIIEHNIINIRIKIEKHRKYIEEKLNWYIEYIHSNLISLKNYSQHKIEIDLAGFEYMLEDLCNKLTGITYDREYMKGLRYIRVGIQFDESDAALIDRFRFNLSVFLSSIGDMKSSISIIKGKIKEMRSSLGRFKIGTPDMQMNDYHQPSKFLPKINPIKNSLKGLIPIAKEMYPIAHAIASQFLPIQNKINQLRGSIVPIRNYLDRSLLDGLGDVRISERQLNLDLIEDDIDNLKMDIRKIIVMLENTRYVIRYLHAIDPLILLEYHKVLLPSSVEEDEDISRMERYLQAFKHLESHVRKYSKSLRTKYRNLKRKGEILEESEMFVENISRFRGELVRKTESHITSLKIIKAMCRNLSEIETKLGSLQVGTNDNGEGMTVPVERLRELRSKFNDFLKITSNINHIRVYYSARDEELKKAKSDIEGLKSVMTEALNLKNYIDNNSKMAVYIDSIKKGVESKIPFVKRLKNLEKIVKYSLNQIEFVIGTYKSISCKILCLKHKEANLEDLSQIKGDILYVRRIIDSIRDDIDCIITITKNLCLVKSTLGEFEHVLCCLLDEIDKHLEETKKNIYVSYIRHFVFAFLRGEKGTPIIDGLKCAKEYLRGIRNVVITTRTVLNLLISGIKETVGSDQTSDVIRKIEKIFEGVREVESSLEEGIICFLKCSNKSINNNTIESTKRMLASGAQVYNNELPKSIPHIRNIQGSENNDNVWILLSNAAIVESKFVASKLYKSITMTDEALKKISWVENCWCVNMFEFDGYYIMGKKMTPVLKFNYEKSREFSSRYKRADWGNYLCICLVINNLLYPNLMRCLCYLIDMDFDTLSTISRKFEKYNINARYKSQVSRFLVFVVSVSMKLSDWVYDKYFPPLIGDQPCKYEKLICFCRCYNDPYYKYFISTIIYISFLVENIFRFDEPAIHHLVQQISSLYDQIYHDVSYYKRPKEARPRKESCICLCSSENRCGCGQGNVNSVCEICKNCKIVCLSICLLCCMIKSFSSKDGCDALKQCVEHTWDKCCICRDSGQISSCLKEISCLSNHGKNNCEGTLISGGCEKIRECVKQMSEQIGGFKDKFKSCFDDFLKKLCCNEPTTGDSDSKRVDYSISRLYISCLYWISKMISVMSYYGEVIWYAARWTEVFGKLHSDISYAIKDVLEPSKNNIILTRGNKIYDSTSVINNKGFEGASNNNYTYNDAYRINTSRAHGSLKYIIIKIVLILIIVVMTIFIRVKIETDDEYKMDNLLAEENGMCECDTVNENGVQNGNKINTTENGPKNNGTKKTIRTKGMKKKSLMIVMSVISGLYLNVVIRDLYVVLSLEYNVWSYFVSVVVCLGLTCSLLSRYCVHLYDFVYVLEQYGLKMSKVESLVDDKFGGESGTSMISSQFVMLYGLLKSVVGDLASALSMSVSQSSYNEMKDELYPYKNMAGALHRMISGSDEYLTNLGKLRESVMESAIVGGCVDLYNVLDFLSYVLMSKTFFEFDEYQAYFHGNERYVAWRLGKSLNHNFFLVSYYRYSTIYSIDAQVQNLKLGEKHMATRNCMMLWRMFGEMEIELITLRSMCEESLDVPMTDIQKDLLKSRFVDEYLTEFQKFQLYVVSTLFNVREHTRVRTREIESSFPFADLFNEQMLDKARLSKLSAKYFDTNYRRLLSSMSLPTRTCDVSGHVEEVQRRVSAFCSHWLDLRYEYCKSIRSLGCEKAVNFAHDLVMSTLKEPEQIDTKITQMLANINLENIDFIQQLLETDETLKEKYQLKEFHNTLDTLTHIHPISDNYETTVLHYLNQYVISSLLNKDKIMLPLGIYLSWYGAALSEQHISCIHKYQFFI